MLSLKDYRVAMGLSQKQLANKLGIHEQTVSRWERGEREPDILMLNRLSELYRCSVDDLVALVIGE